MKLVKILGTPDSALSYMERLVNDGSPSKFSFKNIVSKETCPLYTEQFNICALVDSKSSFLSFGEIPTFEYIYDTIQDDYIFVHPDWTKHTTPYKIMQTDIPVFPTSSSRTVKVNGCDYYIKMFYPGILGRITRELRVEHINSSIEITKILSNLLKSPDAPSTFSFFPEKGGKLYKHPDGDIGYVIRDSIPKGKNTKGIHAIVPAFSLFSSDQQNNDIPIIIQILNQKKSVKSFILEQLFFPIIDCYFFCIIKGGIHPEMHSQNFLIGFDSNFDILSIILRDLESFDKDLSICMNLGLSTSFQSYPFKCIDETQYNYKIKHSFMFDHKLGEYFFDQIIESLVQYRFFEKGQLEYEIKNYVNKKYGEYLTNFFPDNGMWYKFENVLIDRTNIERPYIEIKNPKYR